MTIITSILQTAKNYYHLWQARQAAQKYGHPHRSLKLIGVTGTDGKTTVTSVIYHILLRSGYKTGYISTTAARVGETEIDTGFHVTTPDADKLPAYLRQMLAAGTEYVVLESTSQGLHQNRLGDIQFDAAVITNIKKDHLDYHKSWRNYAEAKFMLVKKIKQNGLLVLNQDDEEAYKWLSGKLENYRKDLLVNSISKEHAVNYKPSFNKLEFSYKGVEFSIPVFGSDYNLENMLLAIELCGRVIPLAKVALALQDYKLPSGRMEVIPARRFKAVVDFAHTPVALTNSLSAIRKLLATNKRIITVFGCAGKRDKGRRTMGKVSALLSDVTILTAEDSRDESLASINDEILATAKRDRAKVVARFADHGDYELTNLGEIKANIETVIKEGQKPFILFDEDNINSRKDAIDLALRLANSGDCVVATGKGHERSLAFGKEEKEFPWSDQEEMARTIMRLGL